jgi:non-lysosomal glucosylceramidase
MGTHRSGNEPRASCAESGGGGGSRRDFLQVVGLGAAALASGLPAVAGPFRPEDFERLIPRDKKLDSAWVRSLTERGAPMVYRGRELDTIGMPVGGICTGQLYLGGDGRLWHWDIFNRYQGTGDAHYAHPPRPESPLSQGFAVRVTAGGKTQVWALDRTGFRDIRFRGQYPIGFVDYRDDDAPVSVTLEAFSPFIPLNPDDSSLPATVLDFTVRNTSKGPVEAELAGWLENAVCLDSGQGRSGVRRNRIRRTFTASFLECSAEPVKYDGQVRPPIVFADFEGATYGPWKVEGEAFGKGPARGPVGVQAGRLRGFLGKGFVNSYQGSDDLHGKLTSPEFKVERAYVSFLVGGGSHAGKTCVNLVVDGKVVRTRTGRDSEEMHWANWDVRDLAGRTAHLEIVDRQSGPWGHILVDQIEFRDSPRTEAGALEAEADFGTLCLALDRRSGPVRHAAALPEGDAPAGLFADDTGDEATRPFGKRLRGGLSGTLKLEPGGEGRVRFVLAWHFPNLRLPGFPGVVGRHYTARFRNARAVADYLVRHFDRLTGDTRLWHRTWYDSTLPYWFLDRTFANTSILATSTCHRFRNGRFWGWEGVGCCHGTCTHVWHYAHAVARLFPELERSAREVQDYGIGFDPKTGAIDHRGEFHVGYAADGQAGCILRAYREHQISTDDGFLRRLWPRVKKSLEYMIAQDGNDDGLIENYQHNTLDTGFWGPSSWLSSLYLAALRAGEEMAREMGDDAFAQRARAIVERGGKNLVKVLWNGEYFIHRPDPRHPEAMRSGDGCEIDQVFGQHWAFQVGLGRILDAEHVRGALRSLYRYNFTPDVGPYRGVRKAGRWYAMPGEAGTIMCTWPKGDDVGAGGKVNPTFAAYFNECMNGFEYQAAGHMVWEGLVREGLAVCRAVHDRYHAARRNPWNEVECGWRVTAFTRRRVATSTMGRRGTWASRRG